MFLVKRQEYLSQLLGFKDERLIKVVSGVRRCGKSTLLLQFMDYLKENGVRNEQIIYINFEDMNFSGLGNAKKLHKYVVSKMQKNKKNYIILDEIQNVKDFEKAVDSFFINENADIYITGSNAKFLSGELATLLSGRYVEISMLPLSFKEYVSFAGETDLERKYADYIMFGSFPQIIFFNRDANKIRAYLDGIYSTVVLKDILSRKKIADTFAFGNVAKFIFDNIGNLLSTNRIANIMSGNGKEINARTIESYLEAMADAFIIYKAKRFDIKGGEYLKTGDKYYLCDIGLRYYLLGNKNTDFGHILENVVYLELRRRGFNVYIGKAGEKEIDFVAQSGDRTEYYQVAYSVKDKSTLERELNPLKSVHDHYPKYLITLDNAPPADFNGIKSMNALEWLLG
jgi:predicted AAA+ superfamily ATPase